MDPIIRTCSLFALAAALFTSVAQARTEPRSALSRYVEGRVAEAEGKDAQARNAYALALAGDATNQQIATRSYRQAVRSGDRALALRAARLLEAADTLTPDGTLFLLADAMSRGDWRDAEVRLTKIESVGNFAFLAPVVRAWIQIGVRSGDPLATLSTRSDGLSIAYSRQNRPFLMLAAGKPEGIEDAIVRSGLFGDRAMSMRISVASRFNALKLRDRALGILAGDEPDVVRARAAVSAGKPIGALINTPSSGIAHLYADVSADLLRDNVTAFALTMAQLAVFADPLLPQAKLALARALSASGSYDQALASLPLDGALASTSNDARFAILISAGRYEEALALSGTWVGKPNPSPSEFARYGDALAQLKRHREAASAFKRAIDAQAARTAPWSLWFLLGREYDLAGDWPHAKLALSSAVELGPDEADALNYYGYTLLTSGENNAEALRLIERASRLRPQDAAITDSLGWAMFKTGKIDDAIATLERAVAGDPTIAEIGRHLGDAYWASGRRVDARYAWNAAMIQAEGDEAREIRARILSGPPAAR